MKCPNCGKYYKELSEKCPHCDAPIIADFTRRERIALFLKRQVPGTRLALSNLSVILVVMINACILSLILNIALFDTFGKAVWCQYVICTLALAYIVLKTLATNCAKILSYTRNCIYLTLIALNITQFITIESVKDVNLWATYFITPAALSFISIFAVVLAMTRKVGSASFFATITANMLLCLFPLIFMLSVHGGSFCPGATANATVLVGLILTSFILFNYIMLRFISLFTRVKRIF